MGSTQPTNLSLWLSGIGSCLGRNRLWVRFLAVSDIYPMFIEPTITWVSSGFSGYLWLDTKIVSKKKKYCMMVRNERHWTLNSANYFRGSSSNQEIKSVTCLWVGNVTYYDRPKWFKIERNEVAYRNEVSVQSINQVVMQGHQHES